MLERCVGLSARWPGLLPDAYLTYRLYDLPPHVSQTVQCSADPVLNDVTSYPLAVTNDVLQYLRSYSCSKLQVKCFFTDDTVISHGCTLSDPAVFGFMCSMTAMTRSRQPTWPKPPSPCEPWLQAERSEVRRGRGWTVDCSWELERAEECDVARWKWFTSVSNKVKSIQSPFFHDTDVAMLEADVVSKWWLLWVIVSVETIFANQYWALLEGHTLTKAGYTKCQCFT